jgi:hypothetical protein
MAEWQHPFDKSTITDGFGDNEPPRKGPHRGADYAPGGGKLIPAVTDSVITRIFYSGCLGWLCEMQSNEHGIYIGHSHLYCNKHDSRDCDGSDHEDGSTCMSKLKVGQKVVMGQPIGRVGNSGTCSRGDHLHLTFSKSPDPRYAKTFDPVSFIDQKIAKQDKAKAKSARVTKRKMSVEPPNQTHTETDCPCCKRPL